MPGRCIIVSSIHLIHPPLIDMKNQLALTRTHSRRSIEKYAFQSAFENRAQFRCPIRLGCDQYDLVSVRVLLHAVEDDEGEEGGGG